MTTSIILTVLGDDRPGIVETLSKLLADRHGNWTDSSMLNLDGKFAGILRATLPTEQADLFLAELPALANQGLLVTAARSDQELASDTHTYRLEMIGQDRSGMLHQLTSALARHHISIEELNTEVRSASMSGEDLFVASANLGVPAGSQIELLRSELEALADELMIDIDLTS